MLVSIVGSMLRTGRARSAECENSVLQKAELEAGANGRVVRAAVV